MVSLDDAEHGDRARQCGTKASPPEKRACLHEEPAKALVMDHMAQMVAAGLADWNILGSGDIWLRLRTGEAFLLGETTITRL
jgi:hypothetical protein